MQGLPHLGHSHAQRIQVRLVVSNAEMITEPTIYPGNVVQFPDIYEFGIDDVAFVAELLNLEIEVVNVDNPASEILLGKTNGNLRHLIPQFDQETQIGLQLIQQDGLIRGEIRLTAIVTEMHTALVELKQKYFEEEQLRIAYNDLVSATKSLEGEMEENMTKAQAQVDKVSKKYNALVEKYNELQDKFVNLSVENERLQSELQAEQEDKEKLQAATSETIIKFRELNEELTIRVSDLTMENETLNQGYLKSTQDALDSKQELEVLYQSKYETEMQLNDRITELSEELERLRNATVSVTVVEEMNIKIQQLITEINRLRVLSVNNSVNCNTQFINNTYIENIVNNLNVTNTYITNILQSGDVEVVRSEFVNLLRRYDDVREGESRLLDRIFSLLHNVRVVGRTRPPSEIEKQGAGIVIESSGELPDVSIYDEREEEWTSFHLDGHWAYDGSQLDIFRDVEPLVHALVPNPIDLVQSPQLASLKRNAAVLVCGGKESGKTFTLFGFGDQLGVAYRTIQSVFTHLDYRSNQLVKEKSRQAKALQSSELAHDPSQEAVFDYSVSLSVVEVRDDVLFDLLGGTSVDSNVIFDESATWVHIPGARRQELKDVNDAMHTLHAAVGAASKRRESSSSVYVVVELVVAVTYHKEEAPVVSRFLLGDVLVRANLPPDSDKNEAAIVQTLKALAENSDVAIDYQTSLLTKVLQGALHAETKSALLFTFAPTSNFIEVTRANAALASNLRHVHREVHVAESAAVDTVVLRAAKRKAKRLAFELKEERQRTVQIEAKLIETKTIAEEYIIQFNERNRAISKHYEDEKRVNQQLQSDLALTLRNLRKSVDELSEQRKVNEKLAALCKLLEKERQAITSAMSTNQSAAASSEAVTTK